MQHHPRNGASSQAAAFYLTDALAWVGQGKPATRAGREYLRNCPQFARVLRRLTYGVLADKSILIRQIEGLDPAPFEFNNFLF